MDDNNKIQLFEDKRIRTAWDEEQEEWYFSVVDVVSILTDQATPRSASTYQAALKKRLIEEGFQLLTKELVLNMLAEATTTELSKNIKPKNFDENNEVATIQKKLYLNNIIMRTCEDVNGKASEHNS